MPLAFGGNSKTGASHVGLEGDSGVFEDAVRRSPAKYGGARTNSVDLSSVATSVAGGLGAGSGAIITWLFREWWRSPDLKVMFEDGKIPYRQVLPNSLPENKKNSTLWIRFQIQNHGRTTATGLKVRLVSIKDLDDGGKDVKEYFPTTLECISGDGAKNFPLEKDDVAIIGLVHRNSAEPDLFELSTVRDGHANGRKLVYGEGHYMFQVKIYGEGMNSIEKKFEVTSGRGFGNLHVEKMPDPKIPFVGKMKDFFEQLF